MKHSVIEGPKRSVIEGNEPNPWMTERFGPSITERSVIEGPKRSVIEGNEPCSAIEGGKRSVIEGTDLTMGK